MKRGSSAFVSGVPITASGLSSSRVLSLPPDGLLCNYHTHLCHGQRLQGYEFCIRHILEDKSAPYKPCAYTGEGAQQTVRCPRAAPRTSRGEGFCGEHSRAVVRARHQLGKRKPGDLGQGASQAALVESLAPYKRAREGEMKVGRVGEGRLGQLLLQGEGVVTEEDGDVGERVGDHWVGEGDSDGESVDSEGEDSLKHAGVYTGEEVMRTMRDKLIRLQKLYIEQFGRLQQKMREGRRAYLAQLRQEKEAGLMSISCQPRDGFGAGYSRLKALAHYHSPAGREALLAARHRTKREGVSGTVGGRASSKVVGPCQHEMTSTTKCGEGVVPMARFCPRHILEQPGQVLYRQCGVVTDPGDGPCETPVASLFPHSTCVFHTRLRERVDREEINVGTTDINKIVNDVFSNVETQVKDVFCSVEDSLERDFATDVMDGVEVLNHSVKDEVLDVEESKTEILTEDKKNADNYPSIDESQSHDNVETDLDADSR